MTELSPVVLAFHDFVQTAEAKKVRLLIASCPMLAHDFAVVYQAGAAFGAALTASHFDTHKAIAQAQQIKAIADVADAARKVA